MQKYSILDVWSGSEYTCVQMAPNNVLCHHNKHLKEYFEFLDGSRIICLPLIIPLLFCWQNSCFGCNSLVDLVVVLEYNFFQLFPTPNKLLRLTRLIKSYKPPYFRSNQPHKLHCFFDRCALRCSKWPRSFFLCCLSTANFTEFA